MIVWIASFPRSGNTFFRIVLHAVYSVNTYSGFLSGDDLVADLGRSDLTGHRRLAVRPSEVGLSQESKGMRRFLNDLELKSEVYFIKTHALPSELWNTKCRAVLLVRDGRDAGISFANYIIDTANTWRRFKVLVVRCLKNRDYFRISRLKYILVRFFMAGGISLAKKFWLRNKLYSYLINGFLTNKGPGNGRWTLINSEWIDRADAQTCVIKFEDLIMRPRNCTRDALKELGIRLSENEAEIPTFAQLQKLHPKFFRSGRLREWEITIDEELNEKFWDAHGSMMSRLGYLKSRVGP